MAYSHNRRTDKAELQGVDRIPGLAQGGEEAGRRECSVLSTTLLVKGLEYSHVLIHDLSGMWNANHAYVALTRASDSLTAIV